uniref:Zinc finger protein 665-like n=1 Tax=Salmo trutta TaxID=8032 RepID=A0A673Y402_SALTR
VDPKNQTVEPESKDIEDQQSQFESAESSEAPTRFTCDICGMTIMNKGNINRHMLTHTKKPFSCEICGENFKRKAQFTRHQGKHARVEEKVEKPYSCTVCGMTFVYSKMRINHERKHIGEDYCSDCGKTFKERDTHECIVYKGERPFRCSECNEDFERQYHLKQHQLEKHPLKVDQTVDPEPESKHFEDQQSHVEEKIEPYRCDKTFKERGDRDMHKCIVYNGDRPFRCSECNEDFERQYHLKRHQLEKHPLKVDQPRPVHDTAMVVQGAQPSNDNDPKADMSTLVKWLQLN